MDVDRRMVVAVEEKRIAILLEELRHHQSVPDRGLGTRLRRGMIAGQVPGRVVCLPRPYAEHHVVYPCDLLQLPAEFLLRRILRRPTENLSQSRRKTQLCFALLRELSSQDAARARIEPHPASSIKDSAANVTSATICELVSGSLRPETWRAARARGCGCRSWAARQARLESLRGRHGPGLARPSRLVGPGRATRAAARAVRPSL